MPVSGAFQKQIDLKALWR